MSDHRAEIVKRVMRSLEDTTDPDQLVNAYFDAEHDIVVQPLAKRWRPRTTSSRRR